MLSSCSCGIAAAGGSCGIAGLAGGSGENGLADGAVANISAPNAAATVRPPKGLEDLKRRDFETMGWDGNVLELIMLTPASDLSRCRANHGGGSKMRGCI